MKYKVRILIITLGVLIIAACQKETSDSQNHDIGYKEKLRSLGFLKNIVENKDHFIIEGDIRIMKSDLDKKKAYTIPKLAQAYAGNSVSLTTITVHIDSSMPTSGDDDWHSEITSAISNWNAVPNFSINFQLTSNTNADITISSDNNQLGDQSNAQGGFPINSLPAASILVNLDAESNRVIPSTLKELIIVHELGHNIGFRHTDYFSEGGTAIVLTGTWASVSGNNNPDPTSVMNSGSNQATQTWRGFSLYDGIAIRTLYPLDVNQKPFFRYRNNSIKRHHYTTNWGEIGYNSNGFGYEGIAGYIYNNNISGTTAFYRYYNSSSRDHFFTTSATPPSGYGSEGIAGYVYSTQVTGSIPLYQYFSSTNGHFYTTNFAELGNGAHGYTYYGIQCYVME